MAKKQAHLEYHPNGEDRMDWFSTLKELKKLHYLQVWSEDPDFHQWSISYYNSRDKRPFLTLMAEMKGGKEWWVIGYIYGDLDIVKDLPTWHQKGKPEE